MKNLTGAMTLFSLGGSLSRAGRLQAGSVQEGETDHERDARVVACKRQLQASLERVWSVMKEYFPADDSGVEYLASLGSGDNYDPLSYAEAITLGFGLAVGKDGRPFTHSDVLAYTLHRFTKPFATSVIYRTFARLIERGLLDTAGIMPNTRTGKPAEFFVVNEDGKEAFCLAILNHLKLASSRRAAA